MTIRKVKGGKYLPWYFNVEAKARARKRADRPKRDILAVKQALANLKLRYCQEVSFWNVRHTGKSGDLDGGLQWVDFAVRPKGKRPFVIILDDPSKRWKAYEKIAYQIKLEGLADRGVPVLILNKGMVSMEHQIKITFFMRKLK